MTVQVRQAEFRDIPAIVRLAQEAHSNSAYRDAMMNVEAIKLVARQAIAMSFGGGQRTTNILVAEEGGEIHGVFIGAVVHLYECLEVVLATNHFWYVSPKGNPRSGLMLLKAFCKWTEGSFDWVLYRIGLSSAIVDPERVEKVMTRQGFKRSGLIVEKEFKRCQQVDC